MATEIEHKYLVNDDSYKAMATERHNITQGYLSRDKGRTIRVRVIDEQAARPEFEYDIPLADAEELLLLCEPPLIQKTRYIVPFHGNRWEVDEFGGDLLGLTLAELEIPCVDYAYDLPPFVGKDVTDDRRYYNSQLGLQTT